MLEHVVRTERATLKYRLLALVAVAVGLYWVRGTFNVGPAVGLALLYLTYSGLLGSVILPRLRTHGVVYGMVVVDALALTAGLYLAGGPQGPLFILLPLLIVYHAMFLGYRSGLFSAFAFSLAYALLTLTTSPQGEIGRLIGLQVPFLFLVGILASYLSQRRLEERREKEDLQEVIRVQTQAQGLLDTAQILAQTWVLEPVLQGIVQDLPRLLGRRYCLVALINKESGRLVGRVSNLEPSSLPGKGPEIISTASYDAATARALETAAPVAVPDGALDSAIFPAWAREMGVTSLLVVPLMANGEKLGVIYLFDTESKPGLTDKDLDVALSYGELAANAIAKAQLQSNAHTRIQQLTRELHGAVRRLDRVKAARRKPQIVVGDMHIDSLQERVTVGGKPVSLSPTEFQLLYVLAENAGQPVNEETLLHRVWGDDYHGPVNVVDVSVHRLRRKLERGPDPQRIVTVRGRGYMLREVFSPPPLPQS